MDHDQLSQTRINQAKSYWMKQIILFLLICISNCSSGYRTTARAAASKAMYCLESLKY